MSTSLVKASRRGAVQGPIQTMSPEWDTLIPLWLHGRPESTRNVYRTEVECLRTQLRNKPVSRITLSDLQNYADTLTGQKPRTVARKLATVKSLLGFAQRTGMIPFNAGAALKLPKVPDDLAQRILETEQVLKMIALEPNPRNKVLLRVLYGAGIRASELCGLCWRHVQQRDDKDGQVTVLGKGAKTRTVRVSRATWKALASIRPDAAALDTPVFVSRLRRPLTRFYVSRIVTRAAKRAGIDAKVSAHWLRHAHATHALDRGAPLPLISATLGHANLSVTGRYTHVRPSESSSKYLDV